MRRFRQGDKVTVHFKKSESPGLIVEYIPQNAWEFWQFSDGERLYVVNSTEIVMIARCNDKETHR